MSHIDEAFIQAYAAPQQPPGVPGVGEVPVAPPQPPLTGLHVGPHIYEHPTSPVSEVVSAAPAVSEPIPAPHFRLPENAQPVEHALPLAAAVAHQSPAMGASTTARRPLSTFAEPQQPATIAFNPVFEVDAFRWPELTDELLSAHQQLLIPVAEQLLDVSEQGRSLVGIAGTQPNIGCATVLMCLARLIASVDKSVALVDANFAKASLARELGLEFDTGWERALTGELPLAECVVKSLQDQVSLLPLSQRTNAANELLASIQTSVTAGVLRYHYDVVLFNLGAAGQPPQYAAAQSVMQHCRLDANIIVASSAENHRDTLNIGPLMELFGSTCLGVIGNTVA